MAPLALALAYTRDKRWLVPTAGAVVQAYMYICLYVYVYILSRHVDCLCWLMDKISTLRSSPIPSESHHPHLFHYFISLHSLCLIFYNVFAFTGPARLIFAKPRLVTLFFFFLSCSFSAGVGAPALELIEWALPPETRISFRAHVVIRKRLRFTARRMGNTLSLLAWCKWFGCFRF